MGEALQPVRRVGRKQTPQRTNFRRLAQSAEIGTVTRGQLIGLAQSLPCLGLINGTEAHLLVVLINTAQTESYNKGGRPIVFKSNAALAFEIGRSEGRVSRMLSRLFDAGVITMQDSGNYKRYPVRNADGNIADACGIDLRVLIARFAELDGMVGQAKAEKNALNAILRRYRGAVRNLRYALATMEDLPTGLRAVIEKRYARVLDAVGIATKASSAVLRRATGLIEWIVERVMQLPRQEQPSERNEDSTCPYAENDTHKQITNPYPFENSRDEMRSANAEQLSFPKTSIAGKRAFEKSLGRNSSQVNQPHHPPQALVALQDLLRAIPALTTYGMSRPRTWVELARLAPQICRMAGISEDARRRAVDQMGEQAAAIAIAITLQKFDERQVTSPGGYLRAMTERAAAGELHLARSVFGLAVRHGMEGIH
ncbi:plasmid replication protein RepC [Brucella anthropi]|uniref:plasmid replication protein RepC n=1 Tax=Brucella anthropi TaxID=529 RepID=UPI000F66A405|nr:plasmid replication protein RepC [Brucella anthropi]MDH0369799.1 plasmid replication protein RepC [Brucella anthropi]RRY16553.1 replication protein C [Brucella anthropi]